MELRPEYILRENVPSFPVGIYMYTFDYDQHTPINIINTPYDEDFAFGQASTYKRCGNVILRYNKDDDTAAIGTLYVSDDCAWMIVNKQRCIQASGSAGSFPLREPETTLISMQVKIEPYRSRSRFDDIIGCG